MNEGLKFLAIEAEKNGVNFQDTNKVVLLPFYPFLDNVYEMITKYIKNPHFSSWAEFIVVTGNDRQFSNMFASWLKYMGKSLECKLISMLLPSNSVSKLKLFLRLRKEIMKISNKQSKSLDDILLQHQDIVGIVHNVYSSGESRRIILEGVKSLFISYKIQQPKIYSCVFVEYALSLYEVIHGEEQSEATIQSQLNNYKTIPQSILGFSSIASHNSMNRPDLKGIQNQTQEECNLSRKYISNFKSIIHDENGLYRKVKSSQVSLQGFKVIDHKFCNESVDRSQFSKPNLDGNRSSVGMKKSSLSMAQPIKSPFLINENRFRSKMTNERSVSPQRDTDYQQNSINVYNENFEIQNEERSIGRINTSHQSYRNYDENQSNYNSREVTPIKFTKRSQYEELNEFDSNNKSIKSLSYSEKYKSPDLSYDLTGNKTKSPLKQSWKPSQQKSSCQLKLLEVIEKDEEFEETNRPKITSEKEPPIQGNSRYSSDEGEGGRDREGREQLLNELRERNRSFRDKMLNSRYSFSVQEGGQSQGVQGDEEECWEGRDKEDFESAPIEVHESIVRHSRGDRWAGAGEVGWF